MHPTPILLLFLPILIIAGQCSTSSIVVDCFLLTQHFRVVSSEHALPVSRRRKKRKHDDITFACEQVYQLVNRQ